MGYVQPVQNECDPAVKSSRMRVVHSFSREDQLDRAAVERLGTCPVMTAIQAGPGGTRRDAATERVLFALVANRALAPSSRLAAAH